VNTGASRGGLGDDEAGLSRVPLIKPRTIFSSFATRHSDINFPVNPRNPLVVYFDTIESQQRRIPSMPKTPQLQRQFQDLHLRFPTNADTFGLR
jgi:hypothetical protein